MNWRMYNETLISSERQQYLYMIEFILIFKKIYAGKMNFLTVNYARLSSNIRERREAHKKPNRPTPILREKSI